MQLKEDENLASEKEYAPHVNTEVIMTKIDLDLNKIISQIINLKLKAKLNCLFSILQTKIKATNKHTFYELKLGSIDYSENAEKLKIGILLNKMLTSTKSLLNIYAFYHQQKLKKYFLKWKYNIKSNKLLANTEQKLKEKYKKIYDDTTKELNKKISSKEKSNEIINKKIESLNETIELKNNKEKELIRNDENISNKIKDLEKEVEKLERKKTEKDNTLSNSSSHSFPKKNEEEEKIKILDKQLNSLENESKEKQAYFTNYVKEMSEMMEFFEQKAEEIKISHKASSQTSPPERIEQRDDNYATKSPASLDSNINYNNYKTNSGYNTTKNKNSQRSTTSGNNYKSTGSSKKGMFINTPYGNFNKKN